MNETLNTIKNRRSIRSYKSEQIKEPELEAILEAGKFAPSGMNTQAWHFSVIQNQALLAKINRIVKEAVLKSGIQPMADRAKAENYSVFYEAPTLIVISGDPQVVISQFNCSVALENMFLAAASLGVGSCWIHAIGQIFTLETSGAMYQEMGIPEGYRIYCSGAFGYRASEAPAPTPRKEGTVNIVK